MAKFEATGLLSVAPGRTRKPASVETEHVISLAVIGNEATIKSINGTYGICAVARGMDVPRGTVHKIVLKCCSSTHAK